MGRLLLAGALLLGAYVALDGPGGVQLGGGSSGSGGAGFGGYTGSSGGAVGGIRNAAGSVLN